MDKTKLSEFLWKNSLSNHNLLRFARPKIGRKDNRGRLVEDQEVFYGDRKIGVFDKDSEEFVAD